MASLEPEALQAALDRYPRHAGFARVEDDRLATLPAAFGDGSYLWKDAEWVVRWYCRRPLAGHDRDAEEAFRSNDMDAIRAAIDGLDDAEDLGAKLRRLTALDGVTVAVASAFLQYVDPEQFAAIDERAWGGLGRTDALSTPYPAPVTGAAYRRFLDALREVADGTGLAAVETARALVVLDVEADGRHR